MAISLAARREALLPRCAVALDLAATQCRRLIAAHPDYFPMYTVAGRWQREGELWTHWCEGFYPGIFWLLYKHTGDAAWRAVAERYSRKLEPRCFDHTVHDLGFIFFSTYLRWYHLTGDAALRDVLIQAGLTLRKRQQKGGYLASFIGPWSLFIDIMMNVGLLFWAANASGDGFLRDIALDHCRTTAAYLVRPDGSTAHEGIFDVQSGRFLTQATQQGWSPESTWSRGLAWAIYGFTAAHRLSGAAEFLDVARRCAAYYLEQTGPSLVPPWDYELPPDVPQLPDSSVAAIAASGFWDLAEAVADGAEKERYQAATLTILESLCSEEFLPLNRPDWEGILLHGVYHFHNKLGVDESVAWGDHFFVEALVKVTTGRSDAAW